VVDSRLAPWLLLLLPAPFEPGAAAASFKPPPGMDADTALAQSCTRMVHAAHLLLPSSKTGQGAANGNPIRALRRSEIQVSPTLFSVSCKANARNSPCLAVATQIAVPVQPILLYTDSNWVAGFCHLLHGWYERTDVASYPAVARTCSCFPLA